MDDAVVRSMGFEEVVQLGKEGKVEEVVCVFVGLGGGDLGGDGRRKGDDVDGCDGVGEVEEVEEDGGTD